MEESSEGSETMPQDLRYMEDNAAHSPKKKTFQCTLCSKTFGYKNGLIRHVRLTHVGEKPYQCNICQRRFGYKHILMEHQNLHFGNRPYACTLCDKRFAARSNLIQHRLVHKKPLSCHMCNKRFDRDDQLRKHLFAHPQSLLTCNFCGFAAASQTDLNKHMMEKHPPQVLDTRDRRRTSMDSGGTSGHEDTNANVTPESLMHSRTPPTAHTPVTLSPNPAMHPQHEHNSAPMSQPTSTIVPHSAAPHNAASNLPPRGNSRIDSMFGHLLRAAAQSSAAANDTATAQSNLHTGIVIKKEVETEGYGDETDTTEETDRDQTPPQNHHNATSTANLAPPAPVNLSTHLPSFSTIASGLTLHSSLHHLSSATHNTLPAISEMFRSRRLHSHPPALPISNPLMTLSENLQQKDFRHPASTHQNLLPVSSMQSFPSSTTAATTSNNNPSLINTPLSSASATPNRHIGTKPTAQLPPISHMLQSTKDSSTQYTSPIPGIPDLEDVLSYYISQGKLFRCQHCNILFFERGMYFLHASLHGSSSPWECSICHKICSDKNEFTLHFVNQQHA